MSFAFRNRVTAGRELAAKLLSYKNRSDVLVLALPRGGVPVAYEVAQALSAPLDVLLVRKLGIPWQKELAMGAIASDGTLILNEDIIHGLGIPDRILQQTIETEQTELTRRDRLYRAGRPRPAVRGRTIIVIDDGLATGSTMQAALQALLRQQPTRIVVAVPVGAMKTCAAVRRLADEVVCARTPEPFYGVGQWYQDFTQISDEEVRALLDASAASFPIATASRQSLLARTL